MSAVKVVEENLMQKFYLNIKEFVKKFSNLKENSLILQTKGRFKGKVVSQSHHLSKTKKNRQSYKRYKSQLQKFLNGKFKVPNLEQGSKLVKVPN